MAPVFADSLANIYGNIPAWWIRAGLNGRVSNRSKLAAYLATQIGEPELLAADTGNGAVSEVQGALERWFASDVPLAGRLFQEFVRDAYWNGRRARGEFRVGGRPVEFGRVRCPVLNVCAEHDELVPPGSSTGFVERVGSSEARNLIFPTGHLGLMVSRAAHQKLWPRVADWLRGDGDPREAARTSVAAVA
jgi:polyhydroxyalkanoate synthase